MLLSRSLVFAAFYAAVYSSPNQTQQTDNSKDPTTARRSRQLLNNTDAQSSKTFKDLVLGTHFKALRMNASAQHLEASNGRGKRSIRNLFKMLGCATNCDRWSLMSYGSYCGLGGSGQPIDDIDRCCQKHDVCYDKIMDDRKIYFSVYIKSYHWRCNRGIPSCSSYQATLWTLETCECDIEFIKCLNMFGCLLSLK